MYLPMHQAGPARVARTPLGPPLRALGQPSRARARARDVELAHIHRRAPRPIDALRTRAVACTLPRGSQSWLIQGAYNIVA